MHFSFWNQLIYMLFGQLTNPGSRLDLIVALGVQICKLKGFFVSKDYSFKLRRIKLYEQETKQTFVFLTNNLEITSFQVALLFKNRWQIELFFQWIKQELIIKSFWGTSENAVRIQIYSAVITYFLVVIIGRELKIEQFIYEIFHVIGISMLNKTLINEVLANICY